MGGDKKAWKLMCDYNIQDVVLLEKVYLKLRGWDERHPNTALWGNVIGCPNCGSDNKQKRGFIRSKEIRLYRVTVYLPSNMPNMLYTVN